MSRNEIKPTSHPDAPFELSCGICCALMVPQYDLMGFNFDRLRGGFVTTEEFPQPFHVRLPEMNK